MLSYRNLLIGKSYTYTCNGNHNEENESSTNQFITIAVVWLHVVLEMWVIRSTVSLIFRHSSLGRTFSRDRPVVTNSSTGSSFGVPWRRSVSRDLASDIDSVFKSTNPSGPRPTGGNCLISNTFLQQFCVVVQIFFFFLKCLYLLCLQYIVSQFYVIFCSMQKLGNFSIPIFETHFSPWKFLYFGILHF